MALVLILSFVARGLARAERVKGVLIYVVLLVAQHRTKQLVFLAAAVTAPIAFDVRDQGLILLTVDTVFLRRVLS